MPRVITVPHPHTQEPIEVPVPLMLVHWCQLKTVDPTKELHGLEIRVVMANNENYSLEEVIARMALYTNILQEQLEDARTQIADIKEHQQRELSDEQGPEAPPEVEGDGPL